MGRKSMEKGRKWNPSRGIGRLESILSGMRERSSEIRRKKEIKSSGKEKNN
jgi:hypothetical protein